MAEKARLMLGAWKHVKFILANFRYNPILNPALPTLKARLDDADTEISDEARKYLYQHYAIMALMFLTAEFPRYNAKWHDGMVELLEYINTRYSNSAFFEPVPTNFTPHNPDYLMGSGSVWLEFPEAEDEDFDSEFYFGPTFRPGSEAKLDYQIWTIHDAAVAADAAVAGNWGLKLKSAYSTMIVDMRSPLIKATRTRNEEAGGKVASAQYLLGEIQSALRLANGDELIAARLLRQYT